MVNPVAVNRNFRIKKKGYLKWASSVEIIKSLRLKIALVRIMHRVDVPKLLVRLSS